jgi:L-alanine-DL-glutamate epimerase-like enolase superfamily enzyme
MSDPATTIADIRAILIALPLRRDWRWRGLGQQLGRWVLVRLETEAGAVGWGEATALADWGGDFGRYYGETPETVIHVVESLIAPAIRGVDVWDERELAVQIGAAIRGHPYARAAVDIALWDVRGQIAGQPIHRLLGGAVRKRIPVAHMIGLMPPAEAAEEAAAAATEGIDAFQVKLTGEVEADVAVLAAVREAVGAASALRGDVNQGYAGMPIKHAIAAVRRLQEAGADLVEQPVEGLEDLAAVRAAVEVPIVADESCWTSADARELTRWKAADAISVYVAKAGGLREALRVAEIAAAHGIPCDVNGSLESGIGTLASVQLAAAADAVTLPAVISCPAPGEVEHPRYAGRYYADDVLSEPVGFDDGDLIVPSGPGLGGTVDQEKVKLLTIDRGD